MTRIRPLSIAALGLAAALATAPVAAQDTITADSGGDITVTPVAHAAMAITWNGITIYNDPAPLGEPADTIAAFEALPDPQIILISDVHGDHFNADVLAAIAGDAVIVAPQAVADTMPEALKAKTTVLANGASTEIAGVTIEAIPMYNTTPDPGAVPRPGPRQRLRRDARRKTHLHRRRHRGYPGDARAHRYRRRIPADEPALHDVR